MVIAVVFVVVGPTGVLCRNFSIKTQGDFERKCATPQTFCCPSMEHHPVDCNFMALQNYSLLKTDKIRGVAESKTVHFR
jgi:hypothetical protein